MRFQLNVTGVAVAEVKSRPWARPGGTLVPNRSGLPHPHTNRSE